MARQRSHHPLQPWLGAFDLSMHTVAIKFHLLGPWVATTQASHCKTPGRVISFCATLEVKASMRLVTDNPNARRGIIEPKLCRPARASRPVGQGRLVASDQ